MNTPELKKISFKCAACKRTLSAPAAAAGKVVVCPCSQKLKVPNARAAAPVSIFDTDLPASPTPYKQPASPYQSTVSTPNRNASTSTSASTSDVGTVKSGQRFLIYAILGYLCSLPVLILANAFLGGTSEKPIVTPAFALILGAGLLGVFAAACCACFGIFRMGRVLFPGTTRFIYAVGVLVPAPIIGLLVMFVANSKATGYLKSKSVAVGFFGAKG